MKSHDDQHHEKSKKFYFSVFFHNKGIWFNQALLEEMLFILFNNESFFLFKDKKRGERSQLLR